MKILFLIVFCHSLLAMAADVYPNFETLSRHEKENEDFKITVVDKHSDVTLLAIHGGSIEPGTSELIRAMNGEFNQYHFEGIKKENNFSLHVTSTHFDEPRALELVSHSQRCLSLHGYRGSGRKSVCVGGGDQNLALMIVNKLKVFEDIEILYPCRAFPGKDKLNIVNRCQQEGVQLEMNDDFRDEILNNSLFRKDIADTLADILSDI